ncbi:Cof-type HAD-IIB family hydrolase [Gemella sp. zg-570]|uniref:Cof-type HAD-IIB family hydrolase n=1 Tax=Gemella sp. zg-570 TaxID=2840371 RepID=UPI001C0AF840|nr:Cof-type HAD-IIB family hydrolase [Gemella sp. zg-570]QWQ38260.1 Cof-type HAD-IIB family hydrolase [Gemella sp. zg-570]
MIKLIATDMDGTFLNSEHKITKENLEAVEYARKNGVEFLVVTGRAYYEALEVITEANFKTEILTLNGAVNYDTSGEITKIFPLDTKDIKFIINELKNIGITCKIYTKNCLYTDSIQEYIQAFIDLVKGQGFEPDVEGLTKEVLRRKDKGHIVEVANVEDYINLADNPTIKIIVLHQDRKKLEEAKNLLEKNTNIEITSSGYNNLEIISKEASKGNALIDICKKKNIDLENVMSLGDNLNDISMLEISKYSVAMKNATPKVKEKSKYITEFDNNNSGVGRMIKKLLKEVNGI